VTHSEVILEEALENNLTLLLDGKADDLAGKQDIRNSLKHFGAEHYVKARERGYVLYVEGGTDVDMLRALAQRINHPVASLWDERINSFYVQNNYPDQDMDAELERVEGGFGITPQQHFNGLRHLLPQLKGLAILDNDGRNRKSQLNDALQVAYWKRYEPENYFITPELLRNFAKSQLPSNDLFAQQSHQTMDDVLNALVLEQVFENAKADFDAWAQANAEVARVLWEAKTERRKLSAFAEEFFRRLSMQTGMPMLLRKGELHRLINHVSPSAIPAEVNEKLDLLSSLFSSANADENTNQTKPYPPTVQAS
jgi:hypothetical protein